MTPFFGSSVSSARALRLDSRGGAGMNGRIGPAPSGKASPLRYARHIAKKHPLKEMAAAQQAAWCRLPFPLALVHLEKQIPFIQKPCRCICKTVNPGCAAIPPRIRNCTLLRLILYHKSRPVSIFFNIFSLFVHSQAFSRQRSPCALKALRGFNSLSIVFSAVLCDRQ